MVLVGLATENLSDLIKENLIPSLYPFVFHRGFCHGAIETFFSFLRVFVMCVVRCALCVCQCVLLYSSGGQKTTLGTGFTFFLKMRCLLLSVTYSS